MNFVIEADDLTKSYSGNVALDHFSLKVTEGMIFGLLGPNGAGKTTAIEIMLGLRSSDSGSVKVLGENPEKKYHLIAPKIGAMLQEGGINPGLKPREAVKLYSSFYPQSHDIDELLELVDLTGVNTNVRRLSGGQAQSLSLALAVVGKPKLVFLDEPTVGMDPRARRRTWELIKTLRESGSTVVLTTHLMDEAEMLCDEIAIVSKGKVIVQGDTKSLTTSDGEEIEVEFQNPVDSEIIESVIGNSFRQITPNIILIETKSSTLLLKQIADIAHETQNMVIKYDSLSKKLEDVFIEMTSESFETEIGDEQ
jgi:ABC-2 type transport system ATP-binding protein